MKVHGGGAGTGTGTGRSGLIFNLWKFILFIMFITDPFCYFVARMMIHPSSQKKRGRLYFLRYVIELYYYYHCYIFAFMFRKTLITAYVIYLLK